MLVVRDDGLILGVTRKNEHTKFGLAGGKLELNETPEQCATRETFEETGICVTACKYLYERIVPSIQSKGVEVYSYCYQAIAWEGEISTNESGKVDWVTIDDILNGAYPEYNKNTLIVAGIIRE